MDTSLCYNDFGEQLAVRFASYSILYKTKSIPLSQRNHSFFFIKGKTAKSTATQFFTNVRKWRSFISLWRHFSKSHTWLFLLSFCIGRRNIESDSNKFAIGRALCQWSRAGNIRDVICCWEFARGVECGSLAQLNYCYDHKLSESLVSERFDFDDFLTNQLKFRDASLPKNAHNILQCHWDLKGDEASLSIFNLSYHRWEISFEGVTLNGVLKHKENNMSYWKIISGI